MKSRTTERKDENYIPLGMKGYKNKVCGNNNDLKVKYGTSMKELLLIH